MGIDRGNGGKGQRQWKENTQVMGERRQTDIWRRGRVGPGCGWGNSLVIHFPAWEHMVCSSAGQSAVLVSKEGLLNDSSPPSALPGLSAGHGAFCLVLPPPGYQPGPEPVRSLSGARRKGGFVSSKDTSKAKNYIPGRPKYACLEKLLAFMKSLVRKAGLQMTASERQ